MTINAHLQRITAGNVAEYGFFCAKNRKDEGYRKKQDWLHKRFREGLVIYLLQDEEGKDLGFIEYLPGEQAWRPVHASGYLFIHCIYLARKAHREQGLGSMLVQQVVADAKAAGLNGVAVATSEGPWIAGRDLFEKNGFEKVDQNGRFELLVHTLKKAPLPSFIHWEDNQDAYPGWHLLLSHQCPWHAKAARALAETARAAGIDLHIREIQTAEEARQGPSGFGVFALLHDGKLLADHYVSQTRFRNILRAEGSADF